MRKKDSMYQKNTVPLPSISRKTRNKEKENTMKFTTLLTIIIVGYVIYYAYQIIHDLFFAKGSLLSDDLRIEEEVDITGGHPSDSNKHQARYGR